MKINVLTLFPEMMEGFFKNSIMARAVESGIISYSLIDWRQYAEDRHHKCDDSPFGGGAAWSLNPNRSLKLWITLMP